MISNLPESDQHRHPNGLGWVANTARVAATCYVGPHALIYGCAELSERVCVVDSAQVSGHAVLSGDVIVSGNAWVSGTTKVSTGRIYKNERKIEKAERIR
jgi:carbonic anhydrase/acetyltransferase-like protein (isoleucine patch superfamily)